MKLNNIYSYKIKTKLFYAIGYSVLVMILLMLIQPIGLIHIGWLKKKIWLITLLGFNYGFFYFIQLFFFDLFFSNILAKVYQTIVYNAFFILLISTFNVYIVFSLFPKNYIVDTINIYLASIAVTSIFHLVYGIITKQLIFTKKKTVNEENNKVETLSIKDSNTVISIPVKDIYFIKSTGNYIEIFEKKNKKRHLLRYSLKDLDNKYSNLYRCHKSYLVNISHISQITGNTKGYKIKLNELPDITIPVSRTKGSTIIKLIS